MFSSWDTWRCLTGFQIWIAGFGLVAGIASFRSGWRATELRLPSSAPRMSACDESGSPGSCDSIGYDAS